MTFILPLSTLINIARFPLPFTSKKIKHFFIITLLGGLLSGCGFHLAGNHQMSESLQQLNFDSSDKYNEISRLVKASLIQQDVVFSNKNGATILRLGEERFERGTLSLFSSGQVAEYELIYTLKYSVIKVNEEPLRFDIIIRRDYLDDPSSAQAKSREREQLLHEIRQQAAKQVASQLGQLD